MLNLNVVLALIILTGGISLYAWSNASLRESWIMTPFLVRRRNEWYRFLTSGFLHADWMHLIFNMIAFYSFGQLIQDVFVQVFGPMGGIWRFLLLYLGGIIVSDIPTYVRHRNDPDYHSLGASGGVASVVFSAILFNPVQGGIYIFPIPFAIPGVIFGVLYLAYSYYQGRKQGDNINHDAHFYGALYGILLTLALVPASASIFWNEVQAYLFK
ncbi:Rhomboid family protein [Hymenobacter roseosalivarius DSM 11622]|uniref:Rhomboid family protein n=1 Tax=Hymenobacter roseosalivarius DSM 11622 TaxID=645990 RepID=A0A1W1UP19_9BACT|nr:rhomboid family intramembrane serine protease [Hymenobacter roseosalivarius]SMB82581.1 Rhomboid family protein [Hymenobacter roseosalivarius DSM 11622]